MSDVRGGKGAPRSEERCDSVPPRCGNASSSVRLCLDLESVVAATHPAFIERYNDEFGTSYCISDVDSWDWVEEEIEFEDFMRIVDELWQKNGGESIEPNESDIDKRVGALAGAADELHMVTARTGVEDSMKTWLKRHDIWQHLDDFEATETYKSQLGYDVYIDDNALLIPELDDDQYLLLYHQLWNDHIEPTDTAHHVLNLQEANAWIRTMKSVESEPREA